MWKPLILIALSGSFFILVSSTGTSEEKIPEHGSTSGLDVSTEHFKEKAVGKNIEQFTANTLQHTVEPTKTDTNSLLEKLTDKSTKIAKDTPIKKLTDTATDIAPEKSIKHTTDNPIEKVTEKSTLNATQNLTSSTERSRISEHQSNSEDKSEENGSNSGLDKTTDINSEESTGHRTETPKGKENEKSTLKPTEKSTDKHKGNVIDKTTAKSIQNTTYKPNSAETPIRCADHETYEERPSKVREPQICEYLGFPFDDCDEDDDDDYRTGQGACICVEGYVRNRHGVCISAENCPSCDKNATLGGGINWCRRCSDYKNEVSCLQVYYVNQCECRDNYVLDDFTGNCVLSEDCSRKSTFDNTKESCSDCMRCNEKGHSDKDQNNPNQCESISNKSDSSEEDGNDDDDNETDINEDNNMGTCSKDNNKDNTISTTTPKSTSSSSECYEEATRLYIPGNIAFGGKLVNELMRLHPTENVLISSPAILYLLAELAVSANGDAYTQIMKALNFKNVELIKCFFERIIPVVLNIPNVEYRLAAKIYSDNVCPLTRDFIQQTKKFFIIEPRNLDFQNPESARIISQEVANRTNNRIVDYIKPKFLSSLSGLALITAEYFEGQWQKQFDPLNTKQRDFYVSNSKTIKVPTMYQKGSFLYIDSPQLDAKIMKMKYVGGEFTLAIVLPNRRDGLKGVMNKFAQPDLIIPVLDSLKMETLEIYLPTFNMTVANKMRLPVEAANVTKIFNNKTAGLEEITPCDGTFVINILQKATLKIDEFGAGQSKSTDFDSEESPEQDNRRPSSLIYRADHPFLICLIYRKFFVFLGTYLG